MSINECDSFPCGNGTCVELIAGFSCECAAGFTGKHCGEILPANKCATAHSPCQNGGTCSFIPPDGYSCHCPGGYTGIDCESSDIDECLSSPCCAGGVCEDGVNTFVCLCDSEWSGELCCECANRYAENENGVCVDQRSSDSKIIGNDKAI